MSNTETEKRVSPIPHDVDPAETAEWLESLDYVLERKGPERVRELLTALEASALRNGVELPFTATTPYINTISRDKQPRYPGNREIERRIKSIIRWNAMAMVVRANRESDGIGGAGCKGHWPRRDVARFRRDQVAQWCEPFTAAQPAAAQSAFPPRVCRWPDV